MTNTVLNTTRAKFEEARLEYIEALKIRVNFLENRVATLDYMDEKFGNCIRQDGERDVYESEISSLHSELSNL